MHEDHYFCQSAIAYRKGLLANELEQEEKDSTTKKLEHLKSLIAQRQEKCTNLACDARRVDRSFKSECSRLQNALYGELQRCFKWRTIEKLYSIVDNVVNDVFVQFWGRS